MPTMTVARAQTIFNKTMFDMSLAADPGYGRLHQKDSAQKILRGIDFWGNSDSAISAKEFLAFIQGNGPYTNLLEKSAYGKLSKADKAAFKKFMKSHGDSMFFKSGSQIFTKAGKYDWQRDGIGYFVSRECTGSFERCFYFTPESLRF